MEATACSLEGIRQRAEEIAMELIRNDLTSNDPSLSGLCEKLERVAPLLRGKDVSDAQVRDLLRKGFNMVKFQPGHGPVGAEAIELLQGLADKLGGMF